jgi:hypothetical protein
VFRRWQATLLLGRHGRGIVLRDSGLLGVAIAPGRATILPFAMGVADLIGLLQGLRSVSHLSLLLASIFGVFLRVLHRDPPPRP